jgi:cobyrinic acid a,c-diamide synthase
MLLSTPRLIVAGLSGDSGKTLVALGLARAFSTRGLNVSPFKKGPDYIDAGWLGSAARAPGRNLDTFLMSREALGAALARGMPTDLILIEGNRGLYDGLDASGSHSTAELAKLLAAPVVLVVDVTKMTRTTAALVKGCADLDPEVDLAGVVLNRVGTARQEKVIREAIRHASGPPVLGAVEHPQRDDTLEYVEQLVNSRTELDALLEAARSVAATSLPEWTPPQPGSPVRIGVFRDEALSFYYPENLEALEHAGADLVTVSPLGDRTLPEVDALYFGGGFPEVHVERLAKNRPIREAVRAAAADGMPVYAECGGLMFLARELIVDGTSHPMAGVLDLVVEQAARPQGHGYVVAEVDRDNPFFPAGTRLRGHEFHYSRVIAGDDFEVTTLRLDRGQGVGGGRDGLVKGRVWASYVHLHALGTPAWATALTDLARVYRQERTNGSGGGAGDGNEDGAERGGQGVAAAGA